MKLIIDIGNTLAKLAIFDDEQIIEIIASENLTQPLLEHLFEKFPGITSAILSSVKDYDSHIDPYLQSKTRFLKFDHLTPLPFANNYHTPETLGKDRLAAVAGIAEVYTELHVLVIDAGTCITYDLFSSEKGYLGGAISPGIQMRFKALNTFTGNLPLINSDLKESVELIGKTTKGSILAGVKRAVINEVDGMIAEYRQTFGDIKTVVTGGDINYFDKYLKNSIFAAPNLVLIGLKKILDFNEGI